jgi:hypothetical protein
VQVFGTVEERTTTLLLTGTVPSFSLFFFLLPLLFVYLCKRFAIPALTRDSLGADIDPICDVRVGTVAVYTASRDAALRVYHDVP